METERNGYCLQWFMLLNKTTMWNNFLLLLLSVLFIGQNDLCAQDTFHVSKKKRPVVAVLPIATWDSTNHDSIISYTVEYPPKSGNIWVTAHLQGPYLLVPIEAPRGKRILFTDIIAIDSSGRKYRQPDRYYISGIWVPKDPPKK